MTKSGYLQDMDPRTEVGTGQGNILEVKPDVTGERKLTGEIHKWVFIIASYKALQSF